MTLFNAPIGSRVTVLTLSGNGATVMQLISAGIMTGAELVVHERKPTGIVFTMDDSSYYLNNGIAAQIEVSTAA